MELIGICQWCSGSPHLCVGTDLATEHSAWPALPTPHKLCTNPISDIHCYYYYLAVWEFFWSMPASTTLCLRTRPSHLYDKLLEVCVTERVSKYARVLVREYMCVHACIALNYIINGQHLMIGCSRERHKSWSHQDIFWPRFEIYFEQIPKPLSSSLASLCIIFQPNHFPQLINTITK